MERKSILTSIAVIVVLLSSVSIFAQTRRITNPETKKRYNQALENAVKARNEEVKAWNNYIGEIDQAEKDVRAVRDGALKGAVTGGAVGAARGAAKASAEALINRREANSRERNTMDRGTRERNTVDRGTRERNTVDRGTGERNTVDRGTRERNTVDRGTRERNKRR